MSKQRATGGTGETGDALRRRRLARQPEPEARLADGRAWADFCSALERAGERVLAAGNARDPIQRAEGFRYLLGLVRSGVGQALELADPKRPRFFRNPDSSSRWGAENADNQYLWARVDPEREYRIVGERGSAFEFLVEVKQGYMQLGDDGVYATRSAADLDIGTDGRFEIILSATPQQGNWLPLHPEARYVSIRQYFCDWKHEQPARFSIECSDPAGPPAPLSAAGATALIDSASDWIELSTRFWNEWVEELLANATPNVVTPARRHVGGPDDIFYGTGLYRLQPDEALVIESELPRARYGQLQLCDLWFASFEWPERQTSLNLHQLHVDDDGGFRCVLAHRDPGVPNWLDCGGRLDGIWQYRWIWAESNPLPSARVLPVTDVRAALPPDTPTISPEERERALRVRARHRALREPAT